MQNSPVDNSKTD